MNKAQRLARERLEQDIYSAIHAATAAVLGSWEDHNVARSIHRARHEIKGAMLHQLARNWRVSERARGSRYIGETK